MRSTRDRGRRGRSGVFRLNQGSSPFGRTSTFRLNQPGGTFGSGRPAGGGAGAGDTLARALTSPAQSVAGPAPIEGPPPAELSGPASTFSSQPVNPFRPPSFDPQPVANLGAILGPSVQPTFDPTILGDRRRTSGTSTIRFF